MEKKVLLLQITEDASVLGRLFTYPKADLLVALEAINGLNNFVETSSEIERISLDLIENTIASLDAEALENPDAEHKLPLLEYDDYADCKPDLIITYWK